MVKAIKITDEAYAALARRKRHPGDSFSKVILRLVSNRGDPLRVAGAWADMSEAEARTLVDQSRRDFSGAGQREES